MTPDKITKVKEGCLLVKNSCLANRANGIQFSWSVLWAPFLPKFREKNGGSKDEWDEFRG